MSRKRFEMTIIRVTEDAHDIRVERTNTLDFEIVEKKENQDDVTHSYGLKDFYELKTMEPFKFFLFIFTGIMKRFLLIVDSEGQPIKETAPAVSGKLLLVSRDWKGLDASIKSAFGSKFQLPKIAFILVIVGALIVLFFLLKSGYIPLPEGLNL